MTILLLPLAVAVIVVLLAAVGPAAAPYPPDAFVARPLLLPSGAHLLGTDAVGHDLFSQLIAGARPSVVAGTLGAAVSTALALVVGVLATAGRRADALARSATDLVLALPVLPLVILVVALAGPSLGTVALALGALSWPAFARVVRAQTLTELTRGHVEAARALGLSPARILARHVAPALLPIVVAKAILTLQYVVLAEASLAFIGLGDPRILSWGGAVERAVAYPLLFAGPTWLWWLVPPAVAIALFVASLAVLGTALDARLLVSGGRSGHQRRPAASRTSTRRHRVERPLG